MAALDSGVPDPQADLARDAVLYRLLVIGEATKALPDPVRDSVPDLPCRNITRLRDLTVDRLHTDHASGATRSCSASADSDTRSSIAKI